MIPEAVPDPWQNVSSSAWEQIAGTPDDRRAFADMVAELRRVQTLANSTCLPLDVTEAATAQLRQLGDLLEPWVVSEWESRAGKRPDLPGRGHSLLPPFVVDEETETTLVGRVVFDRFYLGGNGAAHGGTVPLLFDEVLGRLSNAHGRRRARTAYLHVDYRAITPVGAELVLRAGIAREEGRKRYVTGTLHHGDVLLADAEGLFVVLRPGQP